MRKEHRILLCLFILAFTVGFIFVFGCLHLGLADFEGCDTKKFITRTMDLLVGRLPPDFINIGYEVFLALIFKLTGGIDLTMVRMVNIAVGSFTVVIMYLLGKKFYDERVGLFAAIFTIFHINVLFWMGYVLTDTVFLLPLAFMFLPLFNFAEKNRARHLFSAGFILFIASTVRPVAKLLSPFILFWVIFILVKQRALRVIMLSGFIIVIALIPWIITHNFMQPWEYNTLESYYAARGAIVTGLVWNELERDGPNVISDKSRLMPEQIKKYNKKPFPYTLFLLKKLRVYWSIFHPQMSLGHKVINTLFLTPLYAMAIVGLFFSKRMWKKAGFIIMAIFGFTLASVITIVDYDLRCHLPIELLCNIFSAYGIVVLINKFNRCPASAGGAE